MLGIPVKMIFIIGVIIIVLMIGMNFRTIIFISMLMALVFVVFICRICVGKVVLAASEIVLTTREVVLTRWEAIPWTRLTVLTRGPHIVRGSG